MQQRKAEVEEAVEAEAEAEDQEQEEAAQVRLTADHRACADFFALYMYTMYMRGEMNNMWQGLTWAYDHLGEGFEDLLTRNKNLRPMVESVAAQLKLAALAAGGGMRTERSAPQLDLPLPPVSPAGAKDKG